MYLGVMTAEIRWANARDGRSTLEFTLNQVLPLGNVSQCGFKF